MRVRKALGDFLPLELLSRIHGARGARPASVMFPAAVMFVDVFRYTAFVEQFAHRGHEGLERISALLGSAYARCMEQVGNHGGEFLHLMGDALLAYWPADGNGLGCAVRAANACAAEISRDRNASLESAHTESEPAFHIGVGAGNLWAAALGGQPLWTLVVGGEAVVQAACAQKDARRGECRLSPIARCEIKGGVGEPLQLQQRIDRATSALDDEWLAGFVLPELREAVWWTGSDIREDKSALGDLSIGGDRTAASLENLAEIRPITTLFARIVGLDPHEPRALERHQELCATFQKNLRSRGAPSGDLVYDDKGLTFLTIFGARGSFHRDDPFRAVDAACALVAAAKTLQLSLSVGIATGDAIFRVLGSVHRRQLMVMGTPMNRAARLMTAASTGILCDAPTERAARVSFLFEPHGTLQLTGLGDTAAVFRPLERLPFTASSVELVGRRTELKILKSGYDEAARGRSGILIVSGEPGMGKTTLVQAFADELRSSAIPLFEAPAERENRRTSLLPWRPVIASLLNLATDADNSMLLEAAAARFKDNRSILRMLPLLDGFLSIEIHQSESTRHLEGRHRADATMRLLADIIQAIATRPLVIVLEDSQWFDSASWRLAEWLLASMKSLLLIACVRPEEVPDELKSLQHRLGDGKKIGEAGAQDRTNFCHVLDLEELNERSITEIVSRTLADFPAVHSDISVRINELACGNPLFAEEIALSLRGEGLIAIRDGSWRPIRPLETLQHFEGLERVIRERVDHLNTSCQTILKAAAVIGRSFTVEALASLLKEDTRPDEVDVALESLIAARLVRRAAGSRSCEFRHDQIRDVVYGSIPSDLRQQFHGKLAERIETTQPEGVGDTAALLARHFEASGNKGKAVEYADLAATKALQLGAFREAKAFLEMCLTHASRKQSSTAVQKLQAMRWRRQLAEAHYSLGDLHAQGVCVREALALAGEPAPNSWAQVCLRLLRYSIQLAIQQVFPPKTISKKNSMLGSWEKELTRCLSQAAIGDYFQLRFSRSFCHIIGAAVHGERTGVTAEMALTSAQLACGLGILGYPRLAQRFMTRAERSVSALGDPAVHSQLCIVDALWRIGRCDWPLVDQRIHQAQELCFAAGDQLRWCNAQAIRFWSLYYRGDLSALEHTAQKLLSRAQSSGNVQQEIWALRCKALYLLHTGAPREAVDILRLNASSHSESEDVAEQISATGSLALALARSGLHTESVQAAVKTLDLLGGIGRPTVHTIIVGISGMTEVFLRGREAGISREYDEWSQWEHQALHELNRFRRAFPLGETQYGLWLGVAHWLEGRRTRAMSTWNQALTAARCRSLRQDEAIIAAEIRRRQDQPSRAVS